jgi:DNA-binding ferritin-like protein
MKLPRQGADYKCGELVFELLHSATKTHIAHLLTTSYAAHKALNEFYDEVVGHADDIAEQMQGITEKLLTYPESVNIPPIRTVEDAIVYLRGLYDRVNMVQNAVPYSEIINQLDEVKSLIASTKYKLIFLK